MAIAQYETSQHSFRWKDLEDLGERNRHIQDFRRNDQFVPNENKL